MPRGRKPGTKLSEAHKESLRQALTGNTPWNKGNRRVKIAPDPAIRQAKLQARAEKSAATRRQRTADRYIATAPVEWENVTYHSGPSDYIEAVHRPCGTKLRAQTQTVRRWNWGTDLCHTCVPIFRGTSGAEEDLAAFCNTLGQVQRHLRLDGKEIDIVLPDHHLAIEYDGLYWHSEKAGYPKERHLEKTLLAQKAGLQLVHVFEDEWVHQRHIVEDRLRHLTGHQLQKVGARRCELVEVSAREARQFEEACHLQGSAASSIRLGLRYDGKLLALMTFGRPRYRRDHQWELIRCCVAGGWAVVGGASRLLAAFRSAHTGNIISYADRRWSKGDIYDALGFTLLGTSDPSYFYFKGDLRVNRQTFQKAKLKELPSYQADKTEGQIMAEEGWNRIYDCGTLVYSLT
jgi:hypothetical protein